ncbi:hypothetical protein JMUB7516_27560 [Staphylococcus aureus]
MYKRQDQYIVRPTDIIAGSFGGIFSVSYTHLTLPTILLV